MGLLLFHNCVYKSFLCLHEINIPGVIQEFRLLFLFVCINGKL
jgi:hypothetical protein